MKETLDSVMQNLKSAADRLRLQKLEDNQFMDSLKEDDSVPLHVACAFLLADMALIDGRFDESEYAYIYNRLEGPLGIPKEEANRIVLQAKATLATGRGSSTYAEYLSKTFTPEQRQQAFEMLQGMVLADGKQDDFEIYLQNRIAATLGVTGKPPAIE